jgi:hypothetical protein
MVKEKRSSRTSVPLFVVSNHHSTDAGQAPAIDGDEHGSYHSYFENRHGEQFVFSYQRDTGEGTLWCGDAGWEPHAVVDGRVELLVLSDEERTWLRVCWEAATFGR